MMHVMQDKLKSILKMQHLKHSMDKSIHCKVELILNKVNMMLWLMMIMLKPVPKKH
jgi:hypothetical protein